MKLYLTAIDMAHPINSCQSFYERTTLNSS